MTEIDKDIKRLDNGERSSKTLHTYSQDIKIISNLFGINQNLFDVEKVMEKLNEKYVSKHTVRNKLAFINTYLRTLEFDNKEKVLNQYIKEMKILNYDIGRVNAMHKKTDKQEKNWVSKDDWDCLLQHHKLPDRLSGNKNIKESVKENGSDLKQYRNYIVLTIYRELALRNDLIDTVILMESEFKKLKTNKDTALNHIVLNHKKKRVTLILSNYKTAKTQGEKQIIIPDNDNKDLYHALYVYYKVVLGLHPEMKTIYPKVFLLANNDLSQMSENNFCYYFKNLGKCINKELSSTLIRHCKVSDVYDLDKLQKLANIMGHSVKEAITVYAKL